MSHMITHDGKQVFYGDEFHMRVVFGNLTGRNFHEFEQHSSYLRDMERMALEEGIGEITYGNGATIELIETNGAALDRYVFEA